jgi:glyoxylase-like metal-dependent hydrolase (beta-lactamase superfamily II)
MQDLPSTPSFDAALLREPTPRAPLPPEIPVERLEEGVVLCEIPTPYMMGSTNCWLVIGDEDVLCVDPGTDASAAVEHIDRALEPHGRTVRDIETILVSHTHPDHCGAAAGLAESTGAQVAIGVPEVEALAGQPPSVPSTQAAWRSLGAPPDQVARAVGARLAHEPVPRDRLRGLADGTWLRAGGRTWDVHVVGGHSPGHVVLVSGGTVLAGDHLMANIFPAAHCGPAEAGADEERERDGLFWAPSVAAYLTSLHRFEDGFESARVLPGHGAAFLGTARPLARARRYHRVRCRLVAAQLAARGPSSVWDLALAMYPGLASPEGIDRRFASAAAEVAGRLEALVDAGQAERVRDGDVVRFTAVSSRAAG